MINIQVKFYVEDGTQIDLLLPDNADLKQVYLELNEKHNLANDLGPYKLVVNGVVRSDNYKISEGDDIDILPIMPGG